MVGLHHVCCCEDGDPCHNGCCISTGNYSGSGCPDTYNVNITVSEVCFPCLFPDADCGDWCIPAMDLNFAILTPCGHCPQQPLGWCPEQVVYHCEGTEKSPCVPQPTCVCDPDPFGGVPPGEVISQSITFQYRAGSYWFPPEEGRVRMEFKISTSYGGAEYPAQGHFGWFLRMDKQAPTCLNWEVNDASIHMNGCNNCPIAYWDNCDEFCNNANPSDPNYFGCCYQCQGFDCCEGCTTAHGMLKINGWGRTGDMPIYPRTFSSPAILGFTVT